MNFLDTHLSGQRYFALTHGKCPGFTCEEKSLNLLKNKDKGKSKICGNFSHRK